MEDRMVFSISEEMLDKIMQDITSDRLRGAEKFIFWIASNTKMPIGGLERNEFVLSPARVAKDLNRSRQHVYRYIKTLMSLGYIEKGRWIGMYKKTDKFTASWWSVTKRRV